jgi:OmpA-OmpF porin, OOP family
MTMERRTTRAVITSAFLLCGASAHAADSGFYVGANIGQSDFDLEVGVEAEPGAQLTYTDDVDSKDTAFGVFGGYQFGRWFAVEGAFNHFGKSSIDYAYLYEDAFGALEVNGSSELKAHAFSLAGLLTIPLGESFSLGLRAGVAYSNLDSRSAVTTRFDDGESEFTRARTSEGNIAPVFGANLEYAISPGFSVRADWQRFNDVGKGIQSGFDGFDIDSLNLSIIKRF